MIRVPCIKFNSYVPSFIFHFWFKQGKFECALRLGIEFLEEKGKVVLGLRGRHQQRTNLVKNKVNVNLD